MSHPFDKLIKQIPFGDGKTPRPEEEVLAVIRGRFQEMADVISVLAACGSDDQVAQVFGRIVDTGLRDELLTTVKQNIETVTELNDRYIGAEGVTTYDLDSKTFPLTKYLVKKAWEARYKKQAVWNEPHQLGPPQDRRPVKHRPSTWERLTGIRIIDPDGWRGPHGKKWGAPITEEEWSQRMMVSTVAGYTPQKGKKEV